MIESFTSFYQDNQAILGYMAAFSAIMFVASLLSLPWLLSLIPADYFRSPEPYKAHHSFKHPVLRTSGIVLKNVIGWILILGPGHADTSRTGTTHYPDGHAVNQLSPKA
jgi:hypothetical protein